MRHLLLALAASFLLTTPAAGGEEDSVGWMAAKLLAGKDILDYELAIKNFVSHSDPRVLPTLLKLAEKSDVVPRAEAAGILWFYNDKEIRGRLVGLTKDPETDVQIEAAKSLCLMGYPAYLEIVQGSLLNPSNRIRARAIRALAAIKGDQARAAVETLRASKIESDQIWLAYALYVFGAEPEERMRALEKILQAVPPTAWLPGKADPTESDLERIKKQWEPGVDLRTEAAAALSRIGGERALGILVQATADLALVQNPSGPRALLPRHGEDAALALIRGLQSEKVLVRLGSLATLQRVRPRSDANRIAVANALGRCLSDGAGLVRREALRTITALELRELPSLQLNQALLHSDPHTRRGAARVIATLDLKDSAAAILKQLKTETNNAVRRSLYKTLAVLRSPKTIDPLLLHLWSLYGESRQNSRVSDEIPLCIEALANSGNLAADKALEMLPKVKGGRRKLVIEILARSGSERALSFFMEQLRDSPPAPDAAQVRFFDSLSNQYAPALEEAIQAETAMWIRIVLARALYRLGKYEYGRGIIWGLKNSDPYLRKLAAALSSGIDVPDSTEPLIALLTSDADTARYAARALFSLGVPRAMEGIVGSFSSPTLRRRPPYPFKPFWEGKRSAGRPFSKEVDNDRVWVVYTDDRMGRKMDLFITWSADGKNWNRPAYTGLSSFADPEGHVPPPTFSLQVRGRDITIAHTRKYARSMNPSDLAEETRLRHFALRDFFKDKDEDELPDLEEAALFTDLANPDTDADGYPDGQDKNPLAKPAELGRSDEILKVLAFGYAYLVKGILAKDSHLLVVVNAAGEPRTPELPFFPWLTLHLNSEQLRTLWKATGSGIPRIQFLPTQYAESNEQAVQGIRIWKGIEDEETVLVTFAKRDGQWLVTNYQEQ